MIREYRTISKIAGPLVVVESVTGVTCGEFAELELPTGEVRRCMVLEVDGGAAVVQLFGGAAGAGPMASRMRFPGRPIELAVSDDMLGRVFNGMGDPIDHAPEVLAESYKDIAGLPISPAARSCPDVFIQTGISVIDGLSALARGQKLPVFSGHGLPHARLTAQIARQSIVPGAGGGSFVVVFAGIGITFEESEFFIQEFNRAGTIDRTVFFINLAGDPVTERIAAPRMALTAAEYLAFEKDMHVLVILYDMTNYADAVSEITAARKDAQDRRGYPGCLHTDLASLFERAGMRAGKSGSITIVPVLTMPDDDITHPIPDSTGYAAEGKVVLSRALYYEGLLPPADASLSLSHLMNKSVGKGKTREDHADIKDQLIAAYARGKNARKLLAAAGEASLSAKDLAYVKFADEFETRFVSQGDNENRSIEETLTIGWELLSILPLPELKRVKPELIEKYLPG